MSETIAFKEFINRRNVDKVTSGKKLTKIKFKNQIQSVNFIVAIIRSAEDKNNFLIMPVNEQQTTPAKMFDDHSSGSSSGVSEDEEHECSPVAKKIANQSQKMSSDDRFLSLPSRSHEKFLRTVFDTVLNAAVIDGNRRENKVLEWTDPEEMKKKFDMSLKDEGDSDEELLRLANETIKYSVKTGHPYFVNQLFSCVDPYGFAGQVITDALNPSVYTYEVSPCFILMEEVVLEEMRKIVGYPNGEGDGIFCPGGSAANGYAISCARYHACPDIKVKENSHRAYLPKVKNN